MSYRIVLLSLVTGMFVGALFAYVDLPVPAPPSLAGVMGIVGIYLGFRLVEVVL
jgi:XapX domain-containing protein